jgi:alanine dehydrogenase
LRIEISIRNILPLFTHFVSHSASELRSGGGILLKYHKQCFGESDMKIGIPKEIKTLEFRVGMVPSGVRELVHDGHEVIVETNAGVGIGMTDADYKKAGATVVAKPEAVFAQADLIVKVKEPQLNECAMLRPDQVLFTYLHLAADPEQAKALVDSGTTAIAYETVTAEDGSLPLLTPMSEVAGRLSIQAGAYALQKANGGRGILLGGVPGVAPGKVVIIGGGIAGTNAAEMAIGLGAQVTIIDRSVPRLREIDDIYGGRVHTEYSTKHSIELCVTDADLVVGAVLIAGAAAPKLVTAEHVKQMRAGSVLVDISIDQGGCFETSRPTTHAEPTYVVDDVVHYCVTNMPGAVPRTSTFALTNVTLPFVKSLANLGWVEALSQDEHLAMGLNVHSGHVNYEAVAHELGYDYLSADDALRAA